jgi:hypothetical protein
VRVTLVGTAFAATADTDGRYALDHVPAGEYTLRAELSAYAGAEVAAVLVPGAAWSELTSRSQPGRA